MALHVVDIGPPGPLIQVGIRVGAAFETIGRGGSPHSYTALVDTGASCSTISPRVAADVQPQSAGSTTLGRVDATLTTIRMYKIRMKFEDHLAPGRWFDSMVAEVAPATPGVDVLIGQDLLLQLTLLYNGPLGKLVVMY